MLLEEGIARLRPFAPSCQTIDVASLVDAATRARATLLDLGEARMTEFDLANAPKIARRG